MGLLNFLMFSKLHLEFNDEKDSTKYYLNDHSNFEQLFKRASFWGNKESMKINIQYTTGNNDKK